MQRRGDTKRDCADGCGPIVVERNRFFTGKYMTARDFTAEQDYVLHRHRLHNRLLHGWGVVCGFGVQRHPDPECRDWIVVGPGVAIDCCGRELILTERTPFRLRIPETAYDERPDAPAVPAGPGEDQHAEHGAEDQQQQQQQVPADEKGPEEPREPQQTREPGKPGSRDAYLLCAVYCEEEIEQVPVIYDEGHCDPDRREANRVRETVRLELRHVDDVGPDCWLESGGEETHCRDDCDDELPAEHAGCLRPECACGDCVPLALVGIAHDGTLAIDTRGRRRLPPSPQHLTHIAGSSWVHGATVPIDELQDAGRLELRFDRKLEPADGIATGIGPETFVVHHAGEGEDLEFVPYPPEHPPDLRDGCRAVFTIDPYFLGGRRRGSLVGSVFYVTLHGDFVLDCHGEPVDADHLRGRLPTGNGIPGGTFRSWFRVGPPSGGWEEESR